MRSTVALLAAVAVTVAACGGSGPAEPEVAIEERAATAVTEIDIDRHPVVLAASAEATGDNTWRFDVTMSSPYDTPERYADGWRVLDPAGNELGVRVLTHDHANEQPFTRSGTFDVPSGTSVVLVEGRDLANGWSGQRFEVILDAP